jgi:hypothetical protein
MSFSSDLKDHPDFSKYRDIARSPPRAEFSEMSPEELENMLQANISHTPSLLDRAKSLIGRKSPKRYDPRELRFARFFAQSEFDRTLKKQREYEARVRKEAEDAQNAEDAREAARTAEIRYANERKQAAAAAQAAKERAKYPRVPITKQHLADAQRLVNDLRVAAFSSATTDRFVSPENAYDVRATERDEAIRRLNELQRKFDEQERKTPGAQFVPPVKFPQGSVFTPPPRPGARGHYEGGKSKRVKSKRNKRSTKRRNARK